VIIILIRGRHNRNESKEHYELKQIAKYILYSKGYNCIATEVQFSKYSRYLGDFKTFNHHAVEKNIIDVVGVRGNLMNSRNNTMDDYKVMGIESKASLGDFQNGFCCQCEYTYVIAPKGIIPLDKVPDKIGLIEVDLENYTIKSTSKGFEFTGVETVKQCTSRKKDMYGNRIEAFRIDVFNVLRRIAYRSTVNEVFKKPEIVVGGLKIRKD